MSWDAIRRAVYLRDRGTCQVCLLHVGRLWDAGHLVERYLGGPDTLENLVLMCTHCNRKLKPVHQSPDEARAWLHAQQQIARGKAADTWRPFYDAIFDGRRARGRDTTQRRN